MEGKNYLKVTGILMIIFAGIGFIWVPISIANISTLAVYSKYFANIKLNVDILYASFVVLLIMYLVELAAGILGIVYCQKPEKAKICLIAGVVLLILTILGDILQMIGYSESNLAFSLITGGILPVLYIVGAVLNSKYNGENTDSVSN